MATLQVVEDDSDEAVLLPTVLPVPEPQPEGDPDFHKHEYGQEETCTRCVSKDALSDRPGLQWAFLALGCAPLLGYSCIYISVSFFEEILGATVLSKLGIMQNVPSLCGILGYQALRHKLDYRHVMAACLVYLALLTGGVPLMVLITGTIPPAVLYVAFLVNGLCSGVGLAVAGAIGGLFVGGTADARMVTGGALAHMVPTVVQCALLYRSVGTQTMAQAAAINRTNMYAVFPLGFLGVLAGMLSLLLITRSDVYKRRAPVEMQRIKLVAAPEQKAVGVKKTKGRFAIVWPYALGEWMALMISVYCIATSPHVPAVGNVAFWQSQLTTVIVIAYNFGDLVGRVGANLNAPKLDTWFRNNRWALLTLDVLRLGFPIAILLYIYHPYCTNNYPMVIIYLFMSASNGYLAVKQSQLSQQTCGFNAKHFCPIVGTLMQMSISAGIVCGTSLSFIPL